MAASTYEFGGIFNVLQSCKPKVAPPQDDEETSEDEDNGKVSLMDLFTVTEQPMVEHDDSEDSNSCEVDDADNNEEVGGDNEECVDGDDDGGDDESSLNVEMVSEEDTTTTKVNTLKKEAIVQKKVLPQKDDNAQKNIVAKKDTEKQETVTKKDLDLEEKDAKKTIKKKQVESPERLERTLFVGNVSINVTKKTLKKIFVEFGEIETLRFRSFVGADLKIPKKVAVIKKEFHTECKSLNAYVVYKNKESIGKALKCNGMVLEGLHIRVDTAVPQKKQNSQNSLFIGNLPFNISDEDVYEHFKKCGTIDYVRLIRDKPTGVGKGFGYVAFTNRDGVMFGLKLNGSKLNGRDLRVSRCENTQKFNSGRNSGGGGGFMNKQNRKPNQQHQFQGLKASTSMKDRVKGKKIVQQKQMRTKPNNALRRIRDKGNNGADGAAGNKNKGKSVGKPNQKKMMKKRKM